MINIKPLDAVTFVFFNDPRLKFLTFCCTIKAPFGFHLVGETFDFFSCLYYTSSSVVIEAYILLSLMIIGTYSIIRELVHMIDTHLFNHVKSISKNKTQENSIVGGVMR